MGLNNIYNMNKVSHIEAGKVLARAFHNDPFYTYLIADEEERRKFFPFIFTAFTLYGLQYGEVYATSASLEGLAIWLPSDKARLTPERMAESGANSFLSKIGGKYLQRFSFASSTTEVHEEIISEDHSYLFVFGVEPELHGKGFGGKLLKPMLEKLDNENKPCYLDTNKEKNVSLYQHYGFRVAKKFELADSGVINWAMIREPKK